MDKEAGVPSTTPGSTSARASASTNKRRKMALELGVMKFVAKGVILRSPLWQWPISRLRDFERLQDRFFREKRIYGSLFGA